MAFAKFHNTDSYLWNSEKSWNEGRIVSATYVASGDGNGRLESKSHTRWGKLLSFLFYKTSHEILLQNHFLTHGKIYQKV